MYMRTQPCTRKEYVAALEKTRALSIINDPCRTLGLMVESYNVQPSLQGCLNSLDDKDTFFIYKDPVVAVKGQGGGKSRCLEELRLALLNAKDSKILPLAITFSSAMALLPKEKYAIDSKSPKNNHAYAIVKRMAGVRPWRIWRLQCASKLLQ